MGTKTYAQYCGVAKALDHVGDRWTLLIVRELLVAPRRYSELRAALPGIATNLLALRLDELTQDGIIERAESGYRLTAFGHALEEVIHALVRWGGRWMTDRESGEAFRPEWLVVALRALLPLRRQGRVQLLIEGGEIYLDKNKIDVGRVQDPDALVEGRAEDLLGAIVGESPLSRLRIRGDRKIAEASLGSRKRAAGNAV